MRHLICNLLNWPIRMDDDDDNNLLISRERILELDVVGLHGLLELGILLKDVSGALGVVLLKAISTLQLKMSMRLGMSMPWCMAWRCSSGSPWVCW